MHAEGSRMVVCTRRLIVGAIAVAVAGLGCVRTNSWQRGSITGKMGPSSAETNATADLVRRSGGCQPGHGTVFLLDAPADTPHDQDLGRMEYEVFCALRRALPQASIRLGRSLGAICEPEVDYSDVSGYPGLEGFSPTIVIARTSPSGSHVSSHSLRVRFENAPQPASGSPSPVPHERQDRDQLTPADTGRLIDLLRDTVAGSRWHVGREWCALRASATSQSDVRSRWSLNAWSRDYLMTSLGPSGVPPLMFLLDGGGERPRASDLGLLACRQSGCAGEVETEPGLSPLPLMLRSPLSGLRFSADTTHALVSQSLMEAVFYSSARQHQRLLAPTLLRVLADGGTGSMRHLDLALVSLASAQRNLSSGRFRIAALPIGWAPELQETRTIRVLDHDVSWKEGPIGVNTLRILKLVRESDTTTRPVLVFAAAGNRATPPAPTATMYGTVEIDPKTTIGTNFPSNSFHFPAEWGRRTTDILVNSSKTSTAAHLVVAVGAIDAFGNDHAYTVHGRQAALVAPGQHVFSTAPGPSPTGGLAYYVSSGTSVAAVYAAAAAAQVVASSSVASSLTGRDLARLLYATGVDLGRRNGSYLPIRRISSCRAVRAISCASSAQQHALLTCVRQNRDGRYVYPQLATCAYPSIDKSTCRVACEVEPLAARILNDSVLQSRQTSSGAREHSVGWSYQQQANVTSEPLNEIITAFDIGALGPQPPPRSCPDCVLEWPASLSSRVHVMVALDLKPGITLSDPELVIQDSDQQFRLALDPGGAAPLSSGAEITFKDIYIPDEVSRSAKTTAFLDVKVTAITNAGEIKYIDRSPLIIVSR